MLKKPSGKYWIWGWDSPWEKPIISSECCVLHNLTGLSGLFVYPRATCQRSKVLFIHIMLQYTPLSGNCVGTIVVDPKWITFLLSSARLLACLSINLKHQTSLMHLLWPISHLWGRRMFYYFKEFNLENTSCQNSSQLCMVECGWHYPL